MNILLMGYYGYRNVGDDIFMYKLSTYFDHLESVNTVFVFCQDNYYPPIHNKIKFIPDSQLSKIKRLSILLTNMTKVSICISIYNRVHLLPLAVKSVLDQFAPDWELIIYDDGSIYGTAQLIQKYDHTRIKYIRHVHNIGKSNNMGSGFAAATGEYFLKFDDDDRLTSEFLARTIPILAPEVDFVGTDYWIINSEGMRDEKATALNSLKWEKNL